LADSRNLTGKWDGTFRYLETMLPTTPFLAEITERGGAFDGTIIEPDL
jgi:hypothetical protein